MIIKRRKIKKFIQSMPENKINFTDSDNLFEKGIITSLDLLKVIIFLEETFTIEVNEKDLIPENFASIKKMTFFVKNKVQSSSLVC